MQLEFADMRKALMRLSPDHREALLLITAEGFSYEDAARVCGCAVGTMKSRVNRARSRLVEETSGQPPKTASDHHHHSAEETPPVKRTSR
jgi:RNA polymerase sigma-70 factor (ECF subfamily)